MTERLCTYDQDNHDLRGKPTPEYEELYRQWGLGEIGIIVLVSSPPPNLDQADLHFHPRRNIPVLTPSPHIQL